MHTKVAFVGNSFIYYNDCPRLIEALSGGNVVQNSCLRGGANFEQLIRKGNGMSKTFATSNAKLADGNWDCGASTIVHCTIVRGRSPQAGGGLLNIRVGQNQT